MLLTTTDTLPQPYEPMGLVSASFLSRVGTGLFLKAPTNIDEQLARMYEVLSKRAEKMGADAVVGIHLAHLFGDIQVLMGTAVKFR